MGYRNYNDAIYLRLDEGDEALLPGVKGEDTIVLTKQGRLQGRKNGKLFPDDIYSNIVITTPNITAKALLNIRKPMISYGF